MRSITPVLIDYWHRLPGQSPAVRRLNLAAICDDVRSRRRPHEDLVPFALGDVDAEIVRVATSTYVECAAARSHEHRELALNDTIEWIRRGLALNRGAVFSSLLQTGDPIILGRLTSLRLLLSVEEVTTVCVQLTEPQCRSSVRFLREWQELVDGSSNPTLRRQHEVIGAALDGHRSDIARPAVA
jgi:hypothetical protein